MGQIAMEGMRFYAYHGYYEEERIVGNYYTLNVIIETDFDEAARKDDLAETVNYETVYLICKKVMSTPVNLIETITRTIIQELKNQFKTIQEVQIEIIKQQPLLSLPKHHAKVTDHDSFVSTCARCSQPFICYTDEYCWCQEVHMTSTTRENLKSQYKGCLCNNCLKFFAK